MYIVKLRKITSHTTRWKGWNCVSSRSQPVYQGFKRGMLDTLCLQYRTCSVFSSNFIFRPSYVQEFHKIYKCNIQSLDFLRLASCHFFYTIKILGKQFLPQKRRNFWQLLIWDTSRVNDQIQFKKKIKKKPQNTLIFDQKYIKNTIHLHFPEMLSQNNAKL